MAGCERDASRFGTAAIALAVAISGMVSACGGGGESAERESAALCGSDTWQPVVTFPAGDSSATLAYRDGLLYYSTIQTPAILVTPADGSGSATTLAPVAARQLWLEGSQILFNPVSSVKQVFSVPTEGGTPQMLFDTSASHTGAGYPLVHDLSGVDYYWIEYSMSALHPTVWRASLLGGATEQIATLTPPPDASDEPSTLPGPVAQQMALGEDSLLVWGDGVLETVGFFSGTVQLLVPDKTLLAQGDVIGLDGGGAYWSVPFGDVAKGTDQWSVVQEPADGSAVRTLLPRTAHHTSVFNVWPDGQGGWVAVVDGAFDDGASHTAVSLLSADGTIRTLGCSPTGWKSPEIRAPAIAPDAIYVVTYSFDGTSSQIVRIPR